MGFNLALLILGLLFQTQLAPQVLSFEAATVKPSQAPPGSSSGIVEDKGRIVGTNVTLRRCIRGAYDLPETLIVGGSKWVDEERFDIQAVAGRPAGGDDLMAMLRTLLADRFHLVVHRETRDISGYALVLGKDGLKAAESAPGTGASDSARRGSLDSKASTMKNLAQKLSDALRAPVVDFTGLAGKYDVNLTWNPEDLAAASATKPSAELSGPSIFTALQEQLGLKLESRKVPVEVIVIDSATMPAGF
jgi:uncharacterized protein (TIGR03435 family)